MTIAKRIFLFLLTNILVILTLNIAVTLVSSVLGIPISPNSVSGLILFSAVMGTGGAFISLLMSKTMAKWAMQVQIIDPNTNHFEHRKLVDLIHRLSLKANLPKSPEVGIYESEDLNAFATGPSKSNALVAVSTGLLQRMTAAEIEGVLGHEISHIANGDMVTLTLIQGIVNSFTIFLSRLLSSIIASQADERNRYTIRFLLSMLFDLVFSILGSIVVNYFSRQREFRADKGSSEISSKANMIAALQKLQLVSNQSHNSNLDEDSNNTIASGFDSLKISSKPRSGFIRLFSTHPPLEERIAKLRE
jgi:heat shock protein HtpX